MEQLATVDDSIEQEKQLTAKWAHIFATWTVNEVCSGIAQYVEQYDHDGACQDRKYDEDVSFSLEEALDCAIAREFASADSISGVAVLLKSYNSELRAAQCNATDPQVVATRALLYAELSIIGFSG